MLGRPIYYLPNQCDNKNVSQVSAHILPVGDPAMLITVNVFIEIYFI